MVNQMDSTFLKWAGGKNWFVRQCADLLPADYNRYIDPFLGGGSVFFYLEPEISVLSDINEELITTYRAIQTNWREVRRQLRIHANRHNEQYYYLVRNSDPRADSTIAARMIYLNRTCFNGIYRVNRQGRFNVPIGSHINVILPTDQFERRSEILQGATLFCRDFEETIDEAEEGDLLFCDPPYAVLEEQRFVGYTRNLFDWNCQERLAHSLYRAQTRGVKIVLTNVNHPAVRALYNDDRFEIVEVNRFCSISGRAGGRQQYSEMVVRANID